MAVRKKILRSSTLRTINVIGDYWVLWIMREALLGVRSYSEFYNRTGLTHSTLSGRLRRIVKHGLLTKSSGNTTAPAHPEYRLTDKGRDLFRILLVIRDWERKYYEHDASDLFSGHFVHLNCGKQMQVELICGHCGDPVRTEEVKSTTGPGAGFEPAGPARMQRQIRMSGTRSRSSNLISGVHAIIGDRWATMIVAATNWGCHRFGEFERQLRVSPHILSKRLKMLVERGMLGRRAYQENPLRYEYVLTDKGKSFYPVIVSLMTYGDRWLADKMGPPIILEHMNCGKRLMPVLVCDQCHEALELNDIRFYEQLPCENRDRRSTASN